MEKILRQLNSADSVTQKLVKHFAKTQLDKVQRINGRIARDLNKIGEYAFLDANAYDKLREKYLRGRKGKQWLELLNLMKNQNCKGDFLNDID